VVFIARAENRGSLWLRPMGSETARELPGTEGVTQYVSGWSPDSRSIVFATSEQLKRVAVDGGDPVVLCPLPRLIDRRAAFGFIGASFSPDGDRIAFSFGGELWEVSALGGEPKLLFEPAPNADYLWPQFLPTSDDRQLLIFSMREDRGAWRTEAMDLQTSERHEVGPFSFAVYAPSGHLVHNTATGLGATPFSIETLSAVGETFPLETSGAVPSVSLDGTLVYTDATAGPVRAVVRDRSGQIVRSGDYIRGARGPAIAPNGSRFAVSVQGDIWIYDLERDTATRLTSSLGGNVAPSWLASGLEVSYETGTGVSVQVADGSQAAKAAIARTDGAGGGSASWSLDGRYVSYSGADPTGGEGGIWYREISPGGALSEPITYLRTPFQETMSQISPNSRYLAYRSNESGRQEIYVRPFPEGSGKWQVSTNGGHAPRWAANGTELFYHEGTTLMAVDVSTSGTFTSGRPQRLFETPNLGESFQIHPYDVFPDGKRFLMIDRDTSAAANAVRIVENWVAPIRAR
jgi:serine/threonine-protein kinase